jgi:hypothetical protein
MTRVMVRRCWDMVWGMVFGKLMLEKKRYVTIHMMLYAVSLAMLMMSLMNKTFHDEFIE